jgi:hypothetical protein
MTKLAAILTPLLILALAFAMIGCGAEESPTPTPSPAPTQTAPPTPVPTTPSATATPTPSPTPVPTPVPTLSTDPPCRFHGTVQLNGADVPDGTIITAIIEGDEHTVETPAVYGPSTYAIKIVPPSATPYGEGATIEFRIGGYAAAQTGAWSTGGNIELNLSASSSS